MWICFEVETKGSASVQAGVYATLYVKPKQHNQWDLFWNGLFKKKTKEKEERKLQERLEFMGICTVHEMKKKNI